MEKQEICSNVSGNEADMDVYSLIRSAEIRDYYRRENVCDDWEKKVILIQHAYISVQRKAAMLSQLSGTGNEEENRLTEELCLIYSRYTDMICRPSVRTLFVVESARLRWDEKSGSFGDNMGLDSAYESLDEVIAHMEDLYGDEREKACAHVMVLHVPPDEKVKEVFTFYMFWIDGKWEINHFDISDDELKQQGISDDAIRLFWFGGFQYHPLPFENGCRLKFRLPFMDEPVYGTLESELDGNGCWYHFLYFDEVDGVRGSLMLTYAEIDQTDGYSSIDWIERA